MCFNQLFGDVNTISMVLSKKNNFKCFTIFFKWISLRRMVLLFLLCGASTAQQRQHFQMCVCVHGVHGVCVHGARGLPSFWIPTGLKRAPSFHSYRHSCSLDFRDGTYNKRATSNLVQKPIWIMSGSFFIFFEVLWEDSPNSNRVHAVQGLLECWR